MIKTKIFFCNYCEKLKQNEENQTEILCNRAIYNNIINKDFLSYNLCNICKKAYIFKGRNFDIVDIKLFSKYLNLLNSVVFLDNDLLYKFAFCREYNGETIYYLQPNIFIQEELAVISDFTQNLYYIINEKGEHRA